jgi:hypothetical protein
MSEERLVIPDRDVAVLGLDDFLRKEECVYVGKGPSATRAGEWTSICRVATVNEACLLVDGPVDYAFFTDAVTILNSKPAWDRIRHFVTPVFVHGEGPGAAPVPVDQIDGVPLDRFLCFRQNQSPPEKLPKLHEDGRWLFSDTAVLGFHVLLTLGFTDFVLLGHDGGVGYADGVPCEDRGKNNDDKRAALEMAMTLLKEKFKFTAVWFRGEKSLVV